MSTQLQSLSGNPGDEWKGKYYRALDELEEKEKSWSQNESGLYKSILRLILSYTGMDDRLDQTLSGMRDKLRKESGNKDRNKIIDPVVEEVLGFARNQSPETSQPGSSLAHLTYLLEKLELPEPHQSQLAKLKLSLPDNPDKKGIRPCLDQLSKLINKASKQQDTEKPGIELKTDDPLRQLLENLSLPGDLGIEVISMRKRALEIEEEQDRLLLIQDLVQLLSSSIKNDRTEQTGLENFPHMKETMLELFEWLSIPEEYKTRVEHVKTRIGSLQSDPDLSAVLRDTAIVINDLQSALQVELGDIQDFLVRVTSRLEEVEHCFRDLSSSESEHREETLQLNVNINNSVSNIRDGIAETENVQDIKQNIESRLSFIEQSVGEFFQATQKRQQVWEGTVSTLKGRINSMRGETIKLHQRIQEEYKRAKTDALTGIPNRLAYNEKIKHEFARWQRYSQPFSVCVIDVDKFKGVNDTYGHKAGDKVLQTLAEVCAGKIRKTDFIARYGGEEFVLLMPETGLDQALIVAETLRREIEICKFHYANKPVVITISCGLAEFDKGDTTESVFNRADKALYAAKESGRNRVVSEKQLN